MKYKITPREKISTDSSKSSQFIIYGAINPGVPAYFYLGSMPTRAFL